MMPRRNISTYRHRLNHAHIFSQLLTMRPTASDAPNCLLSSLIALKVCIRNVATRLIILIVECVSDLDSTYKYVFVGWYWYGGTGIY